jgi:alpha-glucosidase (family GH31 glycosyl hydrolase)
MHRQVTRELQYPWRFGDQALANYQFFARLHVRLFPYIYTYAQQASTTGLPIIRPLVLLNQADANTYAVQHVYCFGNEFLVAPMLAPNATQRELYLPAGTWLDFWTNAPHTGGQLITWTNANQAQFPLFVREGAIIPMLRSDVRSLCDANYVNNPQVSTMDGSWLIQAYPAGTSGFSAFDGTSLQCQGTAASGTITISSTARTITLRILGNQPGSVQRDNVVLPEQGTPGSGVPGWRYDAATGFIEIDFTHSGGTTIIEY